VHVQVDRSPRDGKLSPSSCPGTGNRPPNKKKKIQFPGAMPGEDGNRWK